MTVISVIAGDGIGREVVPEAIETLDALGLGLRYDVLDHVNAQSYLRTGAALSDSDLDRVRASDATLLGAVGDPRVTSPDYARGVLLRLRFELDLYVNHRAVTLLHDRLSPLRDEKRRGIDCVIVRENTEGLYAGIGGALRGSSELETALDVEVNTHAGVSRVIAYAFSIARTGVCLVDKSNAVPHGGRLWQRCWAEQCAQWPGIHATHQYVDTAAMRLVADPTAFDVIVANNSHGDILSDLAAQLGGGLGTAASANLNARTGFGLYEPVHGSAPDIAGTGSANPVGAVLSAALMIEHLGHPQEALAVRSAVARSIADRRCTPDLGGTLTTRQAGAAIRAALD
ncbi:dehydrogenase [Streptomyces cellostaticus]|uniref:Dehydrogenase n=1 Tax=Streptomyces cellostaticus TaxID=67285 RepID=A0A101NLV3_9ACTN|nr:isocitrate/isopropylmalate dehydrogenase family protein [Streptomyces cellostaticus]KUM95680.1 dehydrogenase [Streptomyces cellostaticus]GHI09721.1 3-isopropylmalate dehydrogenase [Streptomyces cellostaticus]